MMAPCGAHFFAQPGIGKQTLQRFMPFFLGSGMEMCDAGLAEISNRPYWRCYIGNAQRHVLNGFESRLARSPILSIYLRVDGVQANVYGLKIFQFSFESPFQTLDFNAWNLHFFQACTND